MIRTVSEGLKNRVCEKGEKWPSEGLKTGLAGPWWERRPIREAGSLMRICAIVT